MSKNQFEQLIEYVINDEDAKAKELFHQIVVSKSRQIYENLMQEDNAMGMEPTEIDTDMDEGMMGGSQVGEMIDDVQAEEAGTGMHEDEDEDAEFDDEAEEAGDDLTRDMEDENDMEDDEAASKSDVMDLSDKLDELMAQFEDMMGGGNMGDDMDMDDDMGMDDGMSDEEVDFDELGTEGMMENITLKAAPKPVTSEPAGTNTKSTTAFNSGAAGMAANPVRMTGDTAKGRPNPTAKDMIGNVGNSPAQAKQDLKPATKPHLGQAAGVNTRTPFPKGK
jgi:hypothetical protein